MIWLVEELARQVRVPDPHCAPEAALRAAAHWRERADACRLQPGRDACRAEGAARSPRCGSLREGRLLPPRQTLPKAIPGSEAQRS